MRVREQFQRTISFEKLSSWVRVLWLLTACAAAASGTASAQPARRAAVLALENEAARDDVLARRLTQELRAVVAERPDLSLHETQASLTSLASGNGCSRESLACLARVCRQLGVDALISGRVTRSGVTRTIRVSRFEVRTESTAATALTTLPLGAVSQEALQQRARELASEALDFKAAPRARALGSDATGSATQLFGESLGGRQSAGVDARHITGYALLGGAVVSTGLSVLSWVQIDRAQTNDSIAAYRRSTGQLSANLRDVCDDARSGQSHGLDPTAFARVKSSCSTGKTFEVLQLVFLGGAVVSGGLSAFLLFGGESEKQPRGAVGHVTLHPSVSKRGASLGARIHF